MMKIFKSYISVITLALLAGAGMFSAVPRANAAELNVTLDELKTAYLFNFTKFIDWPAGSAQGLNTELNICMVDPELVASMSEMLAGRTSQGKSLQLLTLAEIGASLEDTGSTEIISEQCHILYINAAQQNASRAVMQALAQQPVLVITDSQAREENTVIRVVQQGDKLRFHINNSLAVAKGLEISANLLSLALSTE